ncbi:MAG: dTDP-4-dehydrorhamnose reductase [Deltaproteobacteria bacterium RBG_16_47_11]|nr:MAG: dTDP-4-dehydrorhamnose reductase [Deltaproteobacteria bacterium RBG_16_47_11]
MNRILVIGAKGMLGRDLTQELQFSFPEDEILEWDIDEIDIREEMSTLTKIEKTRPAIVIHAAGYTDVDGCETNESEAFRVNAEGTRHVAMGAMRCGARVVYLSTDYVFDGKKGEPYLEEDLPNPLNRYGHSKWKGEQYIHELGRDGLIVRTQWLYGRYGKNFVTTILRQAKEKNLLSIVDDQIGSPTYTVDLSRAISVLIQQKANGIFHVVNSESCSWYSFGQAILQYWGMEGVTVVPMSTKELGRKATRPLFSILNTRRFREETGMTLRPWSEALKDFLTLLRK